MTKCNINQDIRNLKTTKSFVGQSLEEKVNKVISSGAPVEAVSPMVYTERKDGVRPEMNIRTDKWAIAQDAMSTIAKGIRGKREQRMSAKEDKPASGNEMNVPADTNNQ